MLLTQVQCCISYVGSLTSKSASRPHGLTSSRPHVCGPAFRAPLVHLLRKTSRLRQFSKQCDSEKARICPLLVLPYATKSSPSIQTEQSSCEGQNTCRSRFKFQPTVIQRVQGSEPGSGFWPPDTPIFLLPDPSRGISSPNRGLASGVGSADLPLRFHTNQNTVRAQLSTIPVLICPSSFVPCCLCCLIGLFALAGVVSSRATL